MTGRHGKGMAMNKAAIEILCPACGEETLLKREPKYDGFKKVGESLLCASCGHEFAGEQDVPYRGRARPAVFDDADRPAAPRVFSGDENARMCRYCADYMVNPFVQRCVRHKREVQATDTCAQFRAKPPPKQDGPGAP